MSNIRTTEPFSTATFSPEVGPARPVRRTIAYRLWVVLFFGANLATLVLLGLQHYYWALVVFFLPTPWYTFQILNASARGLGPAVSRFKTTRREVWLTIDDGPDPESTPKVIALLESHKVRATFFLIGEKVQRHPELVAEILRRGHTIGNHTQTHPYHWFWFGPANKTAKEIDTCADTLRAAGAGSTQWFRSPVGLRNPALHALLAQRGLDLILWSARGYDTACRDPAKVVSRIAANLQPGAILLLHENVPEASNRTELFSKLFAHLSREGYTCVIPSSDALLREG